MISRRTLLAAPLLVSCGTPGSGYRGFAWVATRGSKSVAAVDLLAFAVRHRIALESGPSKLVRSGEALYALLPDSSAIVEIDTKNRGVKRTVRLPGPPLAARIQPDGKRLWALVATPSPALIPVDAQSGKPEKPVTLADVPIAMAASPQQLQAVVTLASGAVQFVDLERRRAFAPVQLLDAHSATSAATGGPPLGEVRYRTDGKVVIVAERARHLLSVVDAASRQIVTQLPLALSPDHMAMNSDGGQLFITGAGRDAVAIMYTYRTEIAQTSLSGRQPGSMAACADPPYLFVSNPMADSITVFDITTQKVVAVTSVGITPGTIAVTPDQQLALVLNETSGDMAVIRVAAISPGRTKRAPLFTMVPVGERPVDLRVMPA